MVMESPAGLLASLSPCLSHLFSRSADWLVDAPAKQCKAHARKLQAAAPPSLLQVLWSRL